MKKQIVASLLVLLFTVGVCTVSCAEVSVSYDPQSLNLYITDTDAVAGKSATVHVVSGEFSQKNPPVVSEMLTAKTNGIEEYVVSMANAGYGKFNLYYGSEAVGASAKIISFIAYDLESEETLKLISKINASASGKELFDLLSDSESAALLGIDSEQEEYLEEITSTIHTLRGKMEETNFTPQSFIQCFHYAKAGVLISKLKNVDAVMTNYASYFGTTYADYIALEESLKSEINSVLLLGAAEKEFVDIDSLTMIAQLRLSKSYGDMKKILLANASAIGLDIGTDSDYEDVKDDLKYLIFYNIFDQRSEWLSYGDVIQDFEDEITEILEEQSEENDDKKTNVAGSSGGSRISKGSVVETTLPSPQPDVQAQDDVDFTDISGHYAQEAIEKLAARGVISGYSDGTFGTEKSITRAEFSKMICLAFDIDDEDECAFDDVEENSWYYPYIAKLTVRSFITGYDGRFYPNECISRQDAALILYRVLSAAGKKAEGTSVEFSDADKISSYAKEAVSSMAAGGYIKGDDGAFRPLDLIRRCDVAVLIDRVSSEVGVN